EAYSDNDIEKEVFLQAAGLSYSGTGDGHVLIWWSNASASDPTSQVIQPTSQAGNYSYSQSPSAPQLFARAQRDQVLGFIRSSVVNGCRVWTRDLFAGMVEVGLMLQEVFDDANRGVPLAKRDKSQLLRIIVTHRYRCWISSRHFISWRFWIL
ncbi:hypothetical protein K443DRAFT_94713, partial [Laccaria amethystina LaAM-08-1]